MDLFLLLGNGTQMKMTTRMRNTGKTNQRTAMNYRKLLLMLKTHSLKLLKEDGKIPIPSDAFSFCRGGRLAGVVVCPLRGDRVFLFFSRKPFS